MPCYLFGDTGFMMLNIVSLIWSSVRFVFFLLTENHDDTVTCHKQTNQAAENRKVPTAMNVKSVDNVDRVQESDCKTSNISQGVLELSDGNAIKEVNVQSKDNESSSIEDSKKNSKREEPQVAKTVSLQDILGGSTITKEDVETFHKENFPESNKHKDSKS